MTDLVREWTICEEHVIGEHRGECPMCKGDRHLVRVVELSSAASARDDEKKKWASLYVAQEEAVEERVRDEYVKSSVFAVLLEAARKVVEPTSLWTFSFGEEANRKDTLRAAIAACDAFLGKDKK